MKADHISEAITLNKDEIIQETATLRGGSEASGQETDPGHRTTDRTMSEHCQADDTDRTPPERRQPAGTGKAWRKSLWPFAGAACVALAVFGAANLLSPDKKPEESHHQEKQGGSGHPDITDLPDSSSQPKISESSPMPSLPLLTISDSAMAPAGSGGGMGQESEPRNSNPWREDMELTAMPVYANPLTPATDSDAYYLVGTDLEKMRTVLLKTADMLGLDTDSLNITDNAPEEKRQQRREMLQLEGITVPESYFDPTKLMTQAEGLSIEVDQDLTVKISFQPPLPLPDNCPFRRDSSDEELSAAAEYLKTAYGNLLPYDSPQAEIRGSHNNSPIVFFDAGGSAVEQILNYHFKRTAFYCNSDGELYMVRIYRTNLSEKLGDYPIVTPAEAEELLEKGNYFSYGSMYWTSETKFTIKDVKLEYLTDKYEIYFMPYYCFTLEGSVQGKEDEKKTYGSRLVPAVREEYLTLTPEWDTAPQPAG